MATSELEKRIERIEAVREIENLMSRYAFYHAASMHDKCLEISALDTPGVSAELPFGLYQGRAGLERLYLGMLGRSDRDVAGRAGKLHQNTMTTSVVEVAEDGQTARGVWICPGHATDRYGEDGGLQGLWRWVKYGCDFAKEPGGWKIWHLRVYGVFGTPYYTSWTDGDGSGPPPPPPLPSELAPDRPAHPLWQYRTDAVYPNDPAPPEPYTTF
jgi:SnoaL-like domain